MGAAAPRSHFLRHVIACTRNCLGHLHSCSRRRHRVGRFRPRRRSRPMRSHRSEELRERGQGTRSQAGTRTGSPSVDARSAGMLGMLGESYLDILGRGARFTTIKGSRSCGPYAAPRAPRTATRFFTHGFWPPADGCYGDAGVNQTVGKARDARQLFGADGSRVIPHRCVVPIRYWWTQPNVRHPTPFPTVFSGKLGELC